MNKTQLKKFKKLLETKREEIVKKAQQTLEQDMALDADDLPDEMDLASSEYLQAFTFRLRGREKTFLDKISKALERIEDVPAHRALHPWTADRGCRHLRSDSCRTLHRSPTSIAVHGHYDRCGRELHIGTTPAG